MKIFEAQHPFERRKLRSRGPGIGAVVRGFSWCFMGLSRAPDGTRIHIGAARFLKVAACLSVVTMLAGCSSLQLTYSFADTVLESKAEDYLDLNEQEQAKVANRADALIAWHKTTMLNRYADFFDRQAIRADSGGWTRAQVADAFNEFRALVDETVKGAAPYIADVLTDHTAHPKMAHFGARMASELAEKREEDAAQTPEQRIDEWVERRVKRMSRFAGSLNAAQVAIIRRYTEMGMDDAGRWHANRQARQEALLTYMAQAPDRDALADFIHRLLIHPHEIADPAYKAVSDRRWSLREDMYFEVLQALSADQKSGLAQTLRAYAADMRALADDKEQAAARTQ